MRVHKVPTGPRIFVALCLLIWFAGAAGQLPQPVRDAPFTAFQTRTTTDADGTRHISTGVVARRSDGSTYWESRNADGTGMVLVWDAVQRRGFQLYLGQAIYTVWEQPSMPEAHTHPAEYAKAYFEQVERAGPSYRQGKTVTTVVGRRVVEGLDVMVTRNAVDDGRQFEEWYSPALEEILRRQAEIPAQGIKTQMKLERVTVGEPDAALFAIPAGYKQVRMEKGHVVWTEP